MTITAGGGTAATSEQASEAELDRLDAWWRAANYLSVGQIYLLDNPLLAQPLRPEHVKPRLLGHWGTTPGLTFLWAHLNRVIVQRGIDAMFRHRARARRARRGRVGVVGGRLLGEVPGRLTGRRRDAQALPAVLVPGRDPQPRGS